MVTLTGGNEEGVPLLNCALVAHVHLVAEEELVLIGRGVPVLKQGQVRRAGPDEVEDLLPLWATDIQLQEQLCVWRHQPPCTSSN